MEGHSKQWREAYEATALEIVRNHMMTRQGYLRALNSEGITERVKWATRGGGKRHRIVTSESIWIANIPQVAEELRGIATKRKGSWEQAAQKGIKRHVWGRGMIGLLQPELSHATDAKPQAESEDCWDDVIGVPLGPVKVRRARREELKEFAKHGVYTKVPEAEC